MTNSPVQDARVTAPPGTPEYQQQVDRQALAAADAAIRMGLVRVICGFFGLFFLVVYVVAVAGDIREAYKFWFPVPIALELLSVAIRGKSVFLRYALSAVRRPETEECNP